MITSFFDFHHHDPEKRFGIYNLNNKQERIDGFFSVGIHPKDAHCYSQSWKEVQELAGLDNCVAVGECGLDALAKVEKEVQENVFLAQIELANRLHKPLIIHCVRLFNEIVRFRKTSEVPMIIHGFNKKKTIAEELLKHNFYLSFGSALLQNVSLQEIFRKVPSNRFFLETDNSGADISKIYETAAHIRSCKVDEIQQQISINFESITDGQKLA